MGSFGQGPIMCSVCPKKTVAAEPEYVTEFSPSAPMALDAEATTDRASWAAALVATHVTSTAAARCLPNLAKAAGWKHGMGGEYSRLPCCGRHRSGAQDPSSRSP